MVNRRFRRMRRRHSSPARAGRVGRREIPACGRSASARPTLGRSPNGREPSFAFRRAALRAAYASWAQLRPEGHSKRRPRRPSSLAPSVLPTPTQAIQQSSARESFARSPDSGRRPQPSRSSEPWRMEPLCRRPSRPHRRSAARRLPGMPTMASHRPSVQSIRPALSRRSPAMPEPAEGYRATARSGRAHHRASTCSRRRR